jgi:hypothetical protein
MELNYKYKSLGDFRKSNLIEYNWLASKNLLEQLCNDMFWTYKKNKPRGYWTLEHCIEETKKFKTKKEWKNGSIGSYDAARKNKWVDELSAHMEEYLKPPGYWTLELCLEQALNFDMKERWKKGHLPSYQAARVYGWVDECSVHMIEGCKPPGYWNKERCIEDAKNYSTFKEWKKTGAGSIQAARINGWMDECSVHIIRTLKKQGYWNIKENCLEEAKKYTRLCDWSKASSGSYTSSRKNGWFEECTAHMTIIRTRKKSK